MIDTVLIHIFTNQWLVFGIVGLLMLAAAEVGHFFGLRLHRRKDEARRGQIGGIQGAMLGLMGLLLGFTFAMAVARFENRRSLVLQEANAIGTTWLRADLLPAAHRAAVRPLLRRYVDARLEFYAAGTDRARVAGAEEAAAGIQRDLWIQAVGAAQAAPTPITAAFITALNDTIDLDASRLEAMRSRVPGAVWLLVLVAASAGCASSGYGSGASGVRNAFANVVLPLLIAVVITLITDLSRSRGGSIGTNQQPMLDLRQVVQADQP